MNFCDEENIAVDSEGLLLFSLSINSMEKFYCPFCEEDTEHEPLEVSGETMWECQKCGVKHT